ncbi:cyclase family protein [Bacteroidia bacterium]|nr:cyclase family protein [Bacteroidia bacterium]
MSKKRIDISVAVTSDLVKWPDSFGFDTAPMLEIAGDIEANVTKIEMDVHFGTHVDAPLHFLANGEDMSTMPLDKLVGRCYVLDCGSATVISEDIAKRVPNSAAKVLFKTTNSALWYDLTHAFKEDFVGINAKGATELANMNLDLVGVDYLSIQGFREHCDTHRNLLKEKVVLLEGIDLREVKEGWYDIYCLPIKLQNIEAAPCRAILVEIDE